MEKLGADAEKEGTDKESHVKKAATIGVEDPVEDYGEEEEGDEVESLVVGIMAKLKGGEASIGGYEKQEEKCG